MADLGAVRRFLAELEAAQIALRSLLADKRRALTAADAGELERIGAHEAERIRELQTLLSRRREILARAAEGGAPLESISELVEAAGGEHAVELKQQIERIRRAADEIRRETWVHWIVARSVSSHYSELLELIANCGRETPTYDERPIAHARGGGAILDASV
jgi:hypothetical protein